MMIECENGVFVNYSFVATVQAMSIPVDGKRFGDRAYRLYGSDDKLLGIAREHIGSKANFNPSDNNRVIVAAYEGFKVVEYWHSENAYTSMPVIAWEVDSTGGMKDDYFVHPICADAISEDWAILMPGGRCVIPTDRTYDNIEGWLEDRRAEAARKNKSA